VEHVERLVRVIDLESNSPLACTQPVLGRTDARKPAHIAESFDCESIERSQDALCDVRIELIEIARSLMTPADQPLHALRSFRLTSSSESVLPSATSALARSVASRSASETGSSSSSAFRSATRSGSCATFNAWSTLCAVSRSSGCSPSINRCSESRTPVVLIRRILRRELSRFLNAATLTEEGTLVEAAGVEPASENSGSLATTCLSLRLISSRRCPESGNRCATSLLVS